jgi:hypothetical protein
MDAEKPVFRPALVLSEADADAALDSGDPERIRLALINGSRCFDDCWAARRAPAMALHPDARVRWAAAFALDQARAAWVPQLRDDFELILLLERLAAHDPDASVRVMVATVLADVIAMLLPSE